MRRRRFLGAGIGTGVAMLSGCLGILGGDDGGGRDYGRITRWSTDGTETGSPPTGFSIVSRSATQLLALDDDVSMDLRSTLDARTSYVWGDVPPEDLAHEIEVTPEGTPFSPYYRVYLGTFDLESARSRLAEASSESADPYEGFDVYPDITPRSGSGDTSAIFAVGEGAVLQSGGVFGNDGSLEILHSVIDAATGATETAVGRHEDLAVAAERMHAGATTNLEVQDPTQSTDMSIGQFAGTTAAGTVGTADGSDVETTAILVFESADAASSADVETYLETVRSSGSMQSISHDVDGRVVTITGRQSASKLVSGA